MSAEKEVKTPSNEEVIDELTKDIDEDLCVNDEDCEDKKEVDDDFVDEVALKDAEVELTDQEKEERHLKSLQLKVKGNDEFKALNFLDSIKAYTEALRICPLKYEYDRAIFYANRAASKIKVDRVVSAIEDCSKAIELNDKYVRAYLRRAKLYEDTDKLDESLKDYETILVLDPGNAEALKATHRLPPLINERNEKLKTEMFDKLKEVGNLFLRPFGLSTNNFQLNQDPNSGGYSINFQQNPPKS